MLSITLVFTLLVYSSIVCFDFFLVRKFECYMIINSRLGTVCIGTEQKLSE